MSKSKFVIDKIAKLFEQGLISYKDLSSEIINILKSKKEEIVYKLDLPSKEEFEVLTKRVEKLEKNLKRTSKKKKNYKGKKILTFKPFNRFDFSSLMFPP